MQVLREAFPDHALLGEEGGVSGDTSSDYLWCIDPLDGTTNYAHKYPLLRGVRGSPGEGRGSGRGCCGVCWGSRHLDPENLHRCGARTRLS